MEIVSILIGVVASVISGMTLFYLQRKTKKDDLREQRKEEAKVKESILILKSINAIGRLCEANAIAIQQGHTNGETHKALEEYAKVDKELFDFLLKQNANKM